MKKKVEGLLSSAIEIGWPTTRLGVRLSKNAEPAMVIILLAAYLEDSILSYHNR